MERIDSFEFSPGELVFGRYEIIDLLGKGWEGEVYLIREKATGVERTAKFFYPHRNIRNKASKFYAKKLHKLRNCSMVIQYHAQEEILIQDTLVTFLISEFIEGELLGKFIERQPGKRLHPFAALSCIGIRHGRDPPYERVSWRPSYGKYHYPKVWFKV